tara:strand:+ start:821 stop:3967 length:3147 start_codon:yes stop_codon:yes gene_type:complete
MANFFIDRPIFAWVVAIIVMIAGAIALRSLPVSQYPDIAPATISISARYPGASAKAVEDTVTQVIEQQMTGLDGLDYMSSSSSSQGAASITLTFKTGTDPDIAQVQVQNKLSLATPLLPQQVQRQGVVVSKASAGFLMVVALVSPNGTFDSIDLGDYARTNIIDPLSRTEGVGNVQLFGSAYAMRIWLDPNKLNQYRLMPSDVIAAITAQNAQVSTGSLGGAPAVEGQSITATISLQTLLSTPEQFRDLLILTTAEGGSVRLGDVARVEMGGENYQTVAKYNGQPAAGMAVALASGANALDTAEAVRAQVDALSGSFPDDLTVVYPFDSTPFISTSIHEVQKTLMEAVVLVFIVILVFLQSFRAAFIPMIAVPVVLLGTFAVLLAFGYSINTFTMFAMVLAIGLLVDDAIVVVENVERVMTEEGLSPREATRKSMNQITGALIGIAVVLSAVFIPMAFFPGSAGVIYRQFSVTIVSAMTLSVLVAIILSPALCATILKSHDKDAAHGKSIVGRGAALFDRGFDKLRSGYESVVQRIVRRRWIFAGVFALMLVALGMGYTSLPSSFLPDEDQGSVMTVVQLPAGATLQRTEDVMDDVWDYYSTAEADNVAGAMLVSGFGFAGQGQNVGMSFIRLNDWEERTAKKDSAASIVGRAFGTFSQRTDASVFPVLPPPIRELGTASGFDLYLKDTGGIGHEALVQARNQLLGMAASDPSLDAVRPNGQEDSPQFKLNLDYQKAQALGVSLSDATSLLSVALGGSYVNDFIDRGRIKKVYVQGDAPFRMQPEAIGDWRVRNNSGEMTPMSELLSSDWQYGASLLQRYNGVPALNIQGQAAPGESSGVAMDKMEELIGQLPNGTGFEWTGISAQERSSGNQTTLLYTLSALFIFLCLAALYESWTVPISVLLVAPIGVMGAVAGAHFGGLSNDVFFQVGLLTTIGLASKNAILIVEFARGLEAEGKELIPATMEAIRIRFRPIMMTSLAFGFGILPLALSSGAGAGARSALGITVLGGMAAVTLLGLFAAPLFYVIVRKLTTRNPKTPAQANGAAS